LNHVYEGTTIMSSIEIEEHVIAAIKKNGRLDSVPVGLDTTFDELKLESLAIICTVFDLEDTFNITIPDDAARNMRCVRDVVDGVAFLIASTPGLSVEGRN
jgi:acyl carrier protein